MSRAKIPPNAHGLAVVSDIAQYRRQVAAEPSQELVELAGFVPGLVLDIRYATADNFLGQALYEDASAYLRRPVAEALLAAQLALQQLGYGLKLWDAYRPYSATVRMYEHLPDETYAAPPWRGSRHNRGCSIDATLVELTSGHELPMPTAFDDLSPRAHTGYEPLPEPIRQNRAALHAVLARQGFVNYAAEWWHFDHVSWADFPLMDLPFAALRG